MQNPGPCRSLGPWISEYQNSGIPECRNIRMSEYQNARIPECQNTRWLARQPAACTRPGSRTGLARPGWPVLDTPDGSGSNECSFANYSLFNRFGVAHIGHRDLHDDEIGVICVFDLRTVQNRIEHFGPGVTAHRPRVSPRVSVPDQNGKFWKRGRAGLAESIFRLFRFVPGPARLVIWPAGPAGWPQEQTTTKDRDRPTETKTATAHAEP